MDSLTQACVGAVIGELCLGKQLGWRAPLWGACIGTIPDLDILANPWLELHEKIRWHRGWSHGLLGLLLGTSIGSAWLYWRYKVDLKKALWVSAAVLFFNILVDCLNAYGTQLYEPFSNHRVAWNLLFIIDPLFTVPLLIAIIVGRFLHKRESDNARRWIVSWITVSIVYVGVALMSKTIVNQRFEHSLEQNDVVSQQWFSAPTPFNVWYWRAVAEVDDGYLIGYACPWDDPDKIPWVFVRHHQDLVQGRMASPGMDTVVWSSFGYWIAAIGDNGQPVLTDIRFGDTWFGRPGYSDVADQGVWVFTLSESGLLERGSPAFRDLGASMRFLWLRITGRVASGL